MLLLDHEGNEEEIDETDESNASFEAGLEDDANLVDDLSDDILNL